MKKVTLFLTALFIFAYSVSATAQDFTFYSGSSMAFSAQPESAQEALNASDCHELLIAKRGCCSWHNGVCGCKGGRVVCCDGSYSPTCTCEHDDDFVRTD